MGLSGFDRLVDLNVSMSGVVSITRESNFHTIKWRK